MKLRKIFGILRAGAEFIFYDPRFLMISLIYFGILIIFPSLGNTLILKIIGLIFLAIYMSYLIPSVKLYAQKTRPKPLTSINISSTFPHLLGFQSLLFLINELMYLMSLFNPARDVLRITWALILIFIYLTFLTPVIICLKKEKWWRAVGNSAEFVIKHLFPTILFYSILMLLSYILSPPTFYVRGKIFRYLNLFRWLTHSLWFVFYPATITLFWIESRRRR